MHDHTDLLEKPRLNKRFRLQWEAVQNAYVLLYPEGMVKLNQSAAEILKRCDGEHTLEQITQELEIAFATTNLREQIVQMLVIAQKNQWIQ